MKTGHEESGALGWGSRDIEYIYRCSRMQRLLSLTESTAKKKKWGKKSEEGWLAHKVGQYKRVEQVSSEEKTKKKKRNTLAELSMQVIVFSGERPNQGLIPRVI